MEANPRSNIDDVLNRYYSDKPTSRVVRVDATTSSSHVGTSASQSTFDSGSGSSGQLGIGIRARVELGVHGQIDSSRGPFLPCAVPVREIDLEDPRK